MLAECTLAISVGSHCGSNRNGCKTAQRVGTRCWLRPPRSKPALSISRFADAFCWLATLTPGMDTSPKEGFVFVSAVMAAGVDGVVVVART